MELKIIRLKKFINYFKDIGKVDFNNPLLNLDEIHLNFEESSLNRDLIIV